LSGVLSFSVADFEMKVMIKDVLPGEMGKGMEKVEQE
jgi:hypothetical protein